MVRAAAGLTFFFFEPRVKHRKYDKGEQRRAEDAPDDYGLERALHLGARAVGESHGHEAEARDCGGHEHGPQAGESALYDGLGQCAAFFSQLVEIAKQDDAVEYRDAGESDETDGGGDAKRHIAQPKRGDAAGDRERDARINEKRLPQRAEGKED